MPSKILFLPGALGRTQFWLPVASKLLHPAAVKHLGWPGLGPTPSDPNVRSLDHLVDRTIAEIDQPTALVAQSMGGVVALRAALEKPRLITHLVLAATSGGVDVAGLVGKDWRPAFHAENPRAPRWFSIYQEDLTPRLAAVKTPTLLLWGDEDQVSPVRVGRRLAELMPCATLHVFRGGDHDLANVLADRIALLIDDHLSNSVLKNSAK